MLSFFLLGHGTGLWCFFNARIRRTLISSFVGWLPILADLLLKQLCCWSRSVNNIRIFIIFVRHCRPHSKPFFLWIFLSWHRWLHLGRVHLMLPIFGWLLGEVLARAFGLLLIGFCHFYVHTAGILRYHRICRSCIIVSLKIWLWCLSCRPRTF